MKISRFLLVTSLLTSPSYASDNHGKKYGQSFESILDIPAEARLTFKGSASRINGLNDSAPTRLFEKQIRHNPYIDSLVPVIGMLKSLSQSEEGVLRSRDALLGFYDGKTLDKKIHRILTPEILSTLKLMGITLVGDYIKGSYVTGIVAGLS